MPQPRIIGNRNVLLDVLKRAEKLLWDKLSDALNDQQKQNKINNLITQLRRMGKIKNNGSKKKSHWVNAD
jgi:hypothetical protein